MKRDEWYNSPLFLKLRLVNHLAGDIKAKTQELYDLLNILNVEHGPLVGDKFCLLERQLRIVDVEAVRLIEASGRFDATMTPKGFDPEPPAVPEGHA